MQYSINDLADGAQIAGDVCIIGAGVLGLTLARELDQAGHRVILVESGGSTPDTPTQALAGGELQGDSQHPALLESRYRYLGGSCNHWGAFCVPFDRVDFATARGIAQLGEWPLAYDSLAPHFQRACAFLEIGSFDFETPTEPGLFALSGNTFLRNVLVKLSPLQNFSAKAQSLVSQLVHSDLVTQANLTELLIKPATDKTIEFARIKSLTGKTCQVRADHFILACGGIENTRLLLHNQLGNDTNQVGLHYNTHYAIKHGYALFHPSKAPRPATSSRVHLLGFKSDFLTSNGLLNCTLQFVRMSDAERSLAFPALARSAVPAYRLVAFVEEPRDNASKIELSAAPDALGVPQARVKHYLKPLMLDSLNSLYQELARELGRLDLGRLNFDPLAALGNPTIEYYRFHHQGGTVMAATSASGVVNPDGRVFGCDNLFVSGSSVFPTGSHANPVLTSLALNYRLADHLKGLL